MDINSQASPKPSKLVRKYSAHDRAVALALLAEGATLAVAGAAVGASPQAVGNWQRRDRIPTVADSDSAEGAEVKAAPLAKALDRVHHLEEENAVLRAACTIFAQPKG